MDRNYDSSSIGPLRDVFYAKLACGMSQCNTQTTTTVANLIRSAKSGNDWTENELQAYNIQVDITFQDAQTFFDETPLPAPSGPQEFLTALAAEDAADADSHFLLTQLDSAVALLRSLGYVQRAQDICTRKELRFLICGEYKYAEPGVCIIDRSANDVILLVQEDRRFGGDTDPYAQLVAEAIAAIILGGRPDFLHWTIRLKVIPGIIMVGTAPTGFFKIPVTQKLSQCVAHGEYPPTLTIVTGHVPDLPRPNRRLSEGMKPLDNRRAILQCYEAFKKFVV